MSINWNEERDKLKPGMIFRTYTGDIVKLIYWVYGDKTKWHVANLYDFRWWYCNRTVEPHDLVEEVSFLIDKLGITDEYYQ